MIKYSDRRCLLRLLGFLVGFLGKHFLHDLLFFNQESTDDPTEVSCHEGWSIILLSDTGGANSSTIGTGDSLFALLGSVEFSGGHVLDLKNSNYNEVIQE